MDTALSKCPNCLGYCILFKSRAWPRCKEGRGGLKGCTMCPVMGHTRDNHAEFERGKTRFTEWEQTLKKDVYGKRPDWLVVDIKDHPNFDPPHGGSQNQAQHRPQSGQGAGSSSQGRSSSKRRHGQAFGYATDRCHECGEAKHDPQPCIKRRLPQDVFGIAKSLSTMLEPDSVKAQGFETMEDLLIFDLNHPRKDQQIKWPNPPKEIRDYTELDRMNVLASVCRYVRPNAPAAVTSSTPATSSAAPQSVSASKGPATAPQSGVPCPFCKEEFPDWPSLSVHVGPCALKQQPQQQEPEVKKE